MVNIKYNIIVTERGEEGKRERGEKGRGEEGKGERVKEGKGEEGNREKGKEREFLLYLLLMNLATLSCIISIL